MMRRVAPLVVVLIALVTLTVPTWTVPVQRQIAERQIPVCNPAIESYISYNGTAGRWECTSTAPTGVFTAITLGGTAIARSAAQINLLTQGVASGYKIARGIHTTVDENDTVVSGLATVVAAICQLQSPPVIGATWVTCDIGNQSGAPAAGSFLVRTYKPTATDNATPTAASTFSIAVAWIAIGT